MIEKCDQCLKTMIVQTHNCNHWHQHQSHHYQSVQIQESFSEKVRGVLPIYFVITDREKVFARQISLLQGDIGGKQSRLGVDKGSNKAIDHEMKQSCHGKADNQNERGYMGAHMGEYGSPHGRRWESCHGLPHGVAAYTEALGKQFCYGRRAHFWPRANYLFNISKTSTPPCTLQ